MIKIVQPIGSARREDNYRRQNKGRPLTRRQMRQIRRMKKRNGEA